MQPTLLLYLSGVAGAECTVFHFLHDEHCHAPNMFGTVNMEHTINLRLSWSEQ